MFNDISFIDFCKYMPILYMIAALHFKQMAWEVVKYSKNTC